MKKLIALCVLISLVSCGKDKPNKPSAPIPDVSIFNQWQPVGQGLHNLDLLDFTQGVIGAQTDIGLEALCDGSYGSSGAVSGAQPSMALFLGSDTYGTIQLGHTKYVGASEPACRELSKEAYQYEIHGNTMTLRMVNYPFEAEYQVVQ